MILSVAIIAILGACNSKQEENIPYEEKPVRVNIIKVKMEEFKNNLQYSGTVIPFQTIPLSFETIGTVETVLVDAGDKVKKGKLLATLDESSSKNLHQIALAKYQQAKDAYDRLKLVYDKGSLPEIKWIEMETNLEQAKYSLEMSKDNLEKCKLYSPVNGLVGHRDIEPGMSAISIGSAPIEIVDIKKVYIKFSIPENEVTKINKGMKATFTVSALDNKLYSGEVASISPVADKISRTYEAKIVLNNPGLELKPGMVCDVRPEGSVRQDVILIPYQSVNHDDMNNSYVFLVDTSKKRVKKQPVVTGQYQGTNLEIIEGLTSGQIIVSEGKEKLSDNTLIAM